MSFLTHPSIPAFSECIISFWFRVPAKTAAEAASAPLVGINPDYPELYSVVPFVVFGGPRTQQEYVFEQPIIATHPNYDASNTIIDGYWNIYSHHGTLEGRYYLDPPYIGFSGGSLVINLQLDHMPQVENWAWEPDDETISVTTIPPDPPGPGSINFYEYRSDPMEVSLESLMRGVPPQYHLTADMDLEVGRWHHCLVSFQLNSTEVTQVELGQTATFGEQVRNAAKVWAVIDDRPIVLEEDSAPPLPGQPNDGSIINYNQYLVATTPYRTDEPVVLAELFTIGFDRPHTGPDGAPFGSSDFGIFPTAVFKPAATYTLANPRISAGVLGIPVHGRFSESTYRVEMAKFEMWIGTSRDVREVEIRRFFITDKGKPATSVKTREAKEAALGKPYIELRKSSDWNKGKNVGRSKKNFRPTAKNRKWKPDPSLRGPQSPADLKK